MIIIPTNFTFDFVMAVVTKTKLKKKLTHFFPTTRITFTINSTINDFIKRKMINYYAYFTCFDKELFILTIFFFNI